MTTLYRPGVLSRFLASVDDLPYHGWWLFPLLYVLLFVWSHGIVWATGQVPFGSIHPVLAVGHFYAPYTLAAIALINRASERALSAFWPATGWPDEERETWRFWFVNSRAGYGLATLVVAAVVTVVAFLEAAPEAIGPGANRTVLFAAYVPSAFFGYWVVLLAFLHTLHQLRLVARIHREATAIDPFDRVSVYAFSYVTAMTGVAYVISGYYTLTLNSAFQAGNPIAIAVLAGVFVIGIACFFLPLWGIHERLVQEKQILVRDVELRLKRLSQEMYRRIDAGEFDGTKVVSDALAGVSDARKRIFEVPTWPWRPQVLSGFLSALLLPVAVYLLTRTIGSQLGP
jgi:hypothetical protein